jgi:hypothetical protein
MGIIFAEQCVVNGVVCVQERYAKIALEFFAERI